MRPLADADHVRHSGALARSGSRLSGRVRRSASAAPARGHAGRPISPAAAMLLAADEAARPGISVGRHPDDNGETNTERESSCRGRIGAERIVVCTVCTDVFWTAWLVRASQGPKASRRKGRENPDEAESDSEGDACVSLRHTVHKTTLARHGASSSRGCSAPLIDESREKTTESSVTVRVADSMFWLGFGTDQDVRIDGRAR